MNKATLVQRAVTPEELMKLSTNFIDMISDCEGLDDTKLRNDLQDYYPLATWLLNTSFARLVRSRSEDPQKFHASADEGVEYEMDLPGAIWTLAPSNQGTDCCWTMPDFAKCASKVPLFMLCLKDCDKIFDKMVAQRLRINERTDLMGIARSGETVEEVNDRIRMLWFAFYLMHTAILGTSTTSDNITKPFHGLLEVMQNDAVISISGANPLAAFASLGCRLDVLGGAGYVFALNPLIYGSLLNVVTPDDRGNYPAGWTRNGDELRFKGISFIRDKLVPVNMTDGTGDIWLLDGDSVGLFFGFNLNNPFIVKDDFTEETKENGCGTMCTYLYNFGSAFSNNANRLAVISGVPVSSACTEIADLAALINPQTLIPAV